MKAKTERSMKQIILQHKGWLLLTIIAMCAYSAGEIMKAQVMKLAIDAAVDTSMALFQKAVILGIVYLLVLWVTYTFDYWCQEKFARKCMISVKNQWFSDIQRKQLCDYDTQESSTYLSHFTVDAMKIEEGYVSKFLSSLEGIIKGVAALGAILSVHYVFVIVIIIGSYLPIFVSLLWQNKMSETQLASSEMNGKMVATLKELLAGFEVNTLFGIKKKVGEKFRKTNEITEEKVLKADFTGDVSMISVGVVSIMIFLGNMLLASFLVLKGMMTVGQTQYVLQLMNNVANPLQTIAPNIAQMKAADAIYKKISAKLAECTESADCVETGSLANAIQLNKVSLEKNERVILDNVSVAFQKNRKYLLVGESGSGKSSLLKILLNLYADYEGKVTVDGRDFRQVNKESWYRSLSVVSQDSFVYHDTIYNNIALFHDYSRKEIEQVIKLCGLEEFVNSHTEGLDFVIEEDGKNISGGERQRICLARALIRKPSVLILDEATSALNSEMAYQIEERILGLPDTTVIAISHRIFPELQKKYDGVVQIQNHKAAFVS